jgi:hypothetical protein
MDCTCKNYRWRSQFRDAHSCTAHGFMEHPSICRNILLEQKHGQFIHWIHEHSVVLTECSINSLRELVALPQPFMILQTLRPHHGMFREIIHRLRKLRSYRLDWMDHPPNPRIVRWIFLCHYFPTREELVYHEVSVVTTKRSVRTSTHIGNLEATDLCSRIIRHSRWIVREHSSRLSHLEHKSPNLTDRP